MAHFTINGNGFPPVGSDFSEMEGTCCYCSDESAERIRGEISSLPLEAIHMLGTGDYHYLSLFWLERIGEPFELLLFDNHPDDQPAAFGGDILSCGGWVTRARELPFCSADRWIRTAKDIADIKDSGFPVYLSIDLDVLSKEYARTDWDQGTMALEELRGAVAAIRATRRIIGADICGGITEAQGGGESDFAINAETVRILCEALG